MFGLFNRSKNTVKNPRILLASIGPDGETLLAAYREIYQSCFRHITGHRAESVSDFFEFIRGKTFDIVHLFAEVNPDGTIQDVFGHQFLEKLSEAETKLLLFARNNAGDNYIEFSREDKRENIKRMNIVMTLDRKGDLFPKFFKSLFGFMASGDTMPQAWVKLVPQNPKLNHIGPETIFSAGLGTLKFVP